MIRDIAIENFRCFENIGLKNLKKINVITGGSGSGKTTLLEALLIAAKGTPEVCLRANKSRALPEAASGFLPFVSAVPTTTPQGFKHTWFGFFHDTGKSIRFRFKDDEGPEKSLEILFGDASSPMQISNATMNDPRASSVLFRRTVGENTQNDIIVSLGQNNQMQVNMNASDLGSPLFYFPSTTQSAESDNVTWFSDLRVSGKADILIRNISMDFPFIKDIQVLSPEGATGIYAILDDKSARPLSLVSAGIHKMFSIYCGISELNKGIILIDEIENGIYYEKYGNMWENLHKMAHASENQLFVTSHSLECLEALAPTLERYTDDFALFRSERKGKDCLVRQITGQSMRAALNGNVDPRGSTQDE